MIQSRHSCCRKGGNECLDDFCSTRYTLAVGAGERLHDGSVDSHPAGNCCYRGAAIHNSGPERYAGPVRSSTHAG